MKALALLRAAFAIDIFNLRNSSDLPVCRQTGGRPTGTLQHLDYKYVMAGGIGNAGESANPV
ncbi:hypothetical protein [Bradyrhizobium sp. NP1]|uniref:hypothetical protein n=1 Tax=Bradyrhizobium sp. NP1 TaxID=3049772 RepID=UPI0025A6697B|nr:hypothetical protein [Bradyrhizobium sp. NP1]WJR77267.1 hypothetical protein QOU61_31800 [Bradyrhizobium sp. NP1]